MTNVQKDDGGLRRKWHRWQKLLKKAAWPVVGSLLGFAAGYFPPYYRLYRDYYAEPLRIVNAPTIKANTFFFRVFPGANKPAQPSSLSTFVRLYNNGDKPLSIVGYSIYVRVDRTWEKLLSVDPPTQLDTIVAFPNGNSTVWVDLESSGFDYKASRSAVPSHGELEGWVYFSSPPSQTAKRMRYEFLDSENKLHTIEAPIGLVPDDTPTLVSLQSVPISFSRRIADVPPEYAPYALKFCQANPSLCPKR
jgi:hypothetical protein